MHQHFAAQNVKKKRAKSERMALNKPIKFALKLINKKLFSIACIVSFKNDSKLPPDLGFHSKACAGS